MKKLLFIFSLFLILSCSNSDDSHNSDSDFNPPEWIQGEWLIENDYDSSGILFSFKKHDFCITNIGISKQCYQDFVNQFRKGSNEVTVTETFNSNSYTVEISYFGGQSLIYSFKKLTNNSIEWTTVPGSVFEKQ